MVHELLMFVEWIIYLFYNVYVFSVNSLCWMYFSVKAVSMYLVNVCRFISKFVVYKYLKEDLECQVYECYKERQDCYKERQEFDNLSMAITGFIWVYWVIGVLLSGLFGIVIAFRCNKKHLNKSRKIKEE